MNNIKNYQKNFIYKIVENDLILKKYTTIRTRFPPEPNGYLHIGHAKSIYLNFKIAQYYHGYCNLRFDDTNPSQENIKYVKAIKQDITWLGFQWHGKAKYSSNYAEILYLYAIELIKKGLAYVDELSSDQIRKYRGTLTSPGKNSPYRSRSIQDNLDLFDKMKNGYFPEGSACLRAKINMTSPYIIMRDPVLYRIKFVEHYRTGKQWCIYSTYDFTHCISDAIEGITHSLCTLEFQDNRCLYNWILNNITLHTEYPHQYEFSRLNLEYTVMSKRYLSILVNKNIVDGWDDPRMPTISGLRRRGYTASSICEFCYRIGITKQENRIKLSTLEACIRKELNESAIRIMAVINPIKIIINNLPEGYEETILVFNHPQKPELGKHSITFTKEIIIEQSDFKEVNDTNLKYRGLLLGQEVRLRHAYVIKAEFIKKNQYGNIVSIICTCDLDTLHKNPTDGRKISGVIHWVSIHRSQKAEFRFYNPLFTLPNPLSKKNFLDAINPDSLIIYHGFIDSSNQTFKFGVSYQFERIGYFCLDNRYSKQTQLIFNRIVSLRNNYFLKN